jgi:hypothetical protein
MDNGVLADKLRKYIGRRVRITSHYRGERTIQYDGTVWPELTSVNLDTFGRVWIHTNDGISQMVVPEGLSIDLEPATGTHDFASGVDRVEAIATALRRYGPTRKQERAWCMCASCSKRRKSEHVDIDSGPTFDEDVASDVTPKQASPTPTPPPPPSDDLDLTGL